MKHTFCNPDHKTNDTLGDGLTKREYFAALAMEGILAAYRKLSIEQRAFLDSNLCASLAVVQADALIAALNRE